MMKRYRINNPSATLYLQRVVDYNRRQSMDPDSLRALSFAITPVNLPIVKDKLQEVLDWFEPENLELLYGKTDDGTLVFNSEYKSVKMIYSNEFSGVRTAIKAVPTLAEYGNQQYAPGVAFYINRQENGIVLRDYQYQQLARFIIDFDFIQWMTFAMNCYQHAITIGNLIPYDENRQYKSWT